MSTYTPFETEMLTMMKEMKTDISELKTDVSEIKSDVSVLKSDVSVLKSDVSVLKSDVSELKSDVSGLKTDMISVKGQLNRMEIWNDKAFGAIEDLRTEVRSDGAATRGMIYEAYDQVADIKDTLATQSTPSIIRTRYPRVTSKR